MFYNKDPRRVQPLVDYLMDEFRSMDYNGEMSFDAVKILSLFRAFYEELNWKFSAWAAEVLERCWPEIHSEHDDVSVVLPLSQSTKANVRQVRAYIGEILAFTGKIKVCRTCVKILDSFNHVANSGNRDLRFLPPKCLLRSAESYPVTTTLWEYGGRTTKVESLSSWNGSKYGVTSECQVFVPSNPHMTGVVAPLLIKWGRFS